MLVFLKRPFLRMTWRRNLIPQSYLLHAVLNSTVLTTLSEGCTYWFYVLVSIWPCTNICCAVEDFFFFFFPSGHRTETDNFATCQSDTSEVAQIYVNPFRPGCTQATHITHIQHSSIFNRNSFSVGIYIISEQSGSYRPHWAIYWCGVQWQQLKTDIQFLESIHCIIPSILRSRFLCITENFTHSILWHSRHTFFFFVGGLFEFDYLL